MRKLNPYTLSEKVVQEMSLLIKKDAKEKHLRTKSRFVEKSIWLLINKIKRKSDFKARSETKAKKTSVVPKKNKRATERTR